MKRPILWKKLLFFVFVLLFMSGCSDIFDDTWEGYNNKNIIKQPSLSENEAGNTLDMESANTNTVSSEIPPIELGEESALLHKEAQNGRYCYEVLSADEQLWYEDIYAILEGMCTDVVLSKEGIDTIGEQGIDKIFQCVMNDHPELFYVGGYSYTLKTLGNVLVDITFSGTYTLDSAQRDYRQKQIDEVVAECLSHISMGASDYAKVKYVYEYLVSNTEYNQNAPDNQNIYSVFIGKQSVCQGYAKATQYLLNELGIKCTLVIGNVIGVRDEGHAWNLVQVEGQYYYVDTTWGDPSYQTTESEQVSMASLPEITYDYLCVTTKELEKTHETNNVVPLPTCVATNANYYVMEGAYFTAYEENTVTAFFEKGYDENKTDVTLKCADRNVYDTFYEQLITKQKIFQFLNSLDGVVAYAENPDKLSLTFWLVNE